MELGHNEISLRQILSLKEGDVIPLQTDASAEIPVEIEGVDRFKGLFGASRGSRGPADGSRGKQEQGIP